MAPSSAAPNGSDSPSLRPSRFGETDEPGEGGGAIVGDLHTGERIRRRRNGTGAGPTRRAPGSQDAGAPTDGEYKSILGDLGLDMGEFYVPARDAHGHTERYQFYVLHGDLVEAQAIVGSHLWPYESLSAMVRHALRRHMLWLNNLQPRPSMIGQVMILNEVLRDDKYNADFIQIFDSVATAMDRYAKMRRPDMAEVLLKKVKAFVDGMPDEGQDGQWKARYQQRMVDEWGQQYPMVFVDEQTGEIPAPIRLVASANGTG